jgi:hypothetical protein
MTTVWRVLVRLAERVVDAFGPLIVCLVLLLVLAEMLGGRWEPWVFRAWLAAVGFLGILLLLLIIVRIVLWHRRKPHD